MHIFIIKCVYLQPINNTLKHQLPKPQPQNPMWDNYWYYGQIVLVNNRNSSYHQVLSGGICPWAIKKCWEQKIKNDDLRD